MESYPLQKCRSPKDSRRPPAGKYRDQRVVSSTEWDTTDQHVSLTAESLRPFETLHSIAFTLCGGVKPASPSGDGLPMKYGIVSGQLSAFLVASRCSVVECILGSASFVHHSHVLKYDDSSAGPPVSGFECLRRTGSRSRPHRSTLRPTAGPVLQAVDEGRAAQRPGGVVGDAGTALDHLRHHIQAAGEWHRRRPPPRRRCIRPAWCLKRLVVHRYLRTLAHPEYAKEVKPMLAQV